MSGSSCSPCRACPPPRHEPAGSSDDGRRRRGSAGSAAGRRRTNRSNGAEAGGERRRGLASRLRRLSRTARASSGREREERNHADQKWDVRVRVKAGERDLTVAFLKSTSALDETIRLPFERPYPAGVNIAGNPQGRRICAAWRSSGPYIRPRVPDDIAESPTHSRLPSRELRRRKPAAPGPFSRRWRAVRIAVR